MSKEIMSIEECAKYLEAGVSMIYKLAQEGKNLQLKSVISGDLEKKK